VNSFARGGPVPHILGVLLVLAGVSAPLFAGEGLLPADRNPVVLGPARFSVMARECIRLEYSATSSFVDPPSLFAVHRESSFADFRVTREEDRLIIDTGRIRLVYAPDERSFHPGNLSAEIRGETGPVTWTPGAANPGNLGGTIRTLDGVTGPVDLGQGLLSRDGWSLVDDSTTHLFTETWVCERPADSGLDWYLFGYGHDYRAALRALTAVAGKVPLTRRCVFGAWYSRYWPYSQKDYLDIARQYREHGFPLDVMVLDMDWHREGWTGWSWNRELLPGPEKLFRALHRDGLQVTLNVHPADGVGPHEDAYADFMRCLGEDPVSGERIPFDAGNEKYVEALFEHTHADKERIGVDFWWLDWQQYPYTLSLPRLTNLWWLNECYTRHTSSSGLRGISFSRWAGWGDHRHPIHFSGDAGTNWESLAFEVPFTSTAGNVGCFFWSHDIGGHMGARNEESYARWCQFGLTTAALRSHSTRSAELDRRPWTYSPRAEESMRRSFLLRSRLFPYLYSSIRQSCEESVPLTRPMYLEYPEEERAYRSPQQYLLGDAFLVAPIVTPGVGPERVGRQEVWFPGGTWYDFFTGERFEGEQTRIASATLDEFPLYVRGGVPIPMRAPTLRMTSDPLAELVVRCCPGEAGTESTTVLYQDDGFTNDHERGLFETTALTALWSEKGLCLTIHPARGVHRGQVQRRRVVVELAGVEGLGAVTIDDEPGRAEPGEDPWSFRISVPERSIREKIVVRCELRPADQERVREKIRRRRIEGILGPPLPPASAGTDEPDLAAGVTGDELARFALPETVSSEELEALAALSGVGALRGEALFRVDSGVADADRFRFRIVDREGVRATVLQDETIEASSPRLLRAAGLPEPDQGEKGFGVPRVREATLSFEISGKVVEWTRRIFSQDHHLRRWSVVGPFAYDRSSPLPAQSHPPEQDAEGDSYALVDGTARGWRRVEAREDAVVDLRQVLGGDDRLAYALTHIVSPEAQEIVLFFNTDDGAQAWLNGKEIYQADLPRPLSHPTDRVAARLRKGQNLLVLKVAQLGGGWEFRVGLETLLPVEER